MFEENGRETDHHTNMLRHNSFSYPMNEIRNPYELVVQQHLGMNGGVSQTPRLKAKTFSSPILNGYDQ